MEIGMHQVLDFEELGGLYVILADFFSLNYISKTCSLDMGSLYVHIIAMHFVRTFQQYQNIKI
jgi:hypothetical protein